MTKREGENEGGKNKHADTTNKALPGWMHEEKLCLLSNRFETTWNRLVKPGASFKRAGMHAGGTVQENSFWKQDTVGRSGSRISSQASLWNGLKYLFH